MSNEPADHVSDHELLARFIMFSDWIRADGSLRQDAYIPPPKDLQLSVTRHVGLSEDGIWQRGQDVATERGKPLLGRADISAKAIRDTEGKTLDVIPFPLERNPQHAHVIGWPADKPRQKYLAQRLAAGATYLSH